MSKNWTTRNGQPSIKGLFKNGVWHCECDPRLPAEKFQVKNGGKNHGRWFFTCQMPQQKRCKFFLWADDAKMREESAVLGNNRSEPAAQNIAKITSDDRVRNVVQAPQTPRRQVKPYQPITPMSKPRSRTPSPLRDLSKGTFDLQDPRFRTNSPIIDEKLNDDSHEWSSSEDDGLLVFLNNLDTQQTLPADGSLPHVQKAARTTQRTSPSKVSHQLVTTGGAVSCDLASTSKWSITHFRDGIAIPSTPVRSSHSACLRSCDAVIPDTRRQLFPSDLPQIHSEAVSEISNPLRKDCLELPVEAAALASSVMTLLSPIRSCLPPKTERSLIDLLNKHELRAMGISRGREVARLVIKNKDTMISEMQSRIDKLETDKATAQLIYDHYKSEICRMQNSKKLGSPG